MSDWEYHDDICPKCEDQLRTRDCYYCDPDLPGQVDNYDDDPINYPRQYVSYHRCGYCQGHGHHIWCGSCGWDVLEEEYINGKPAFYEHGEAIQISLRGRWVNCELRQEKEGSMVWLAVFTDNEFPIVDWDKVRKKPLVVEVNKSIK